MEKSMDGRTGRLPVVSARMSPGGGWRGGSRNRIRDKVSVSERRTRSRLRGAGHADADEDLGFAVRVRILWSWMGRKPVQGGLRIHPASWYKARSAEKHPRHREKLQGENPEDPQSWFAVTSE